MYERIEVDETAIQVYPKPVSATEKWNLGAASACSTVRRISPASVNLMAFPNQRFQHLLQDQSASPFTWAPAPDRQSQISSNPLRWGGGARRIHRGVEQFIKHQGRRSKLTSNPDSTLEGSEL